MSDMWPGTADATRVGPRTMAPVLGFTPWGRRLDPAPPRAFDPEEEANLPPAAPVIDPEAIALDGFARGFEEGRRTLEQPLADERAALATLAGTLDALRPAPPGALAVLLRETVGRLVREIVGEAAVDPALLRARAEAAAAIVTAETRPARMRLHPDDVGRLADADLPVELVADTALAPGSVVVECRDGWIEDGPAVALERLQAQLDRLAVPR